MLQIPREMDRREREKNGGMGVELGLSSRYVSQEKLFFFFFKERVNTVKIYTLLQKKETFLNVNVLVEDIFLASFALPSKDCYNLGK